MTTAAQPLPSARTETRFPFWLFSGYLLLWLVTAINPRDRQDWLLENLLVVPLVFLLVRLRSTHPLSYVSYVLVTAFLALHAIGAYYTYAYVPVGDWIRGILGSNRNHFDRVAHFSFGLLVAYPLQDWLARYTRLHGVWLYYVPVEFILAASAFFELIECWLVHLVDPTLGEAYLGSQGDTWDAQKDITVALIGSLLTMGGAWLWRTGRKRHL